MYCPECGKFNSDTAKQCEFCNCKLSNESNFSESETSKKNTNHKPQKYNIIQIVFSAVLIVFIVLSVINIYRLISLKNEYQRIDTICENISKYNWEFDNLKQAYVKSANAVDQPGNTYYPQGDNTLLSIDDLENSAQSVAECLNDSVENFRSIETGIDTDSIIQSLNKITNNFKEFKQNLIFGSERVAESSGLNRTTIIQASKNEYITMNQIISYEKEHIDMQFEQIFQINTDISNDLSAVNSSLVIYFIFDAVTFFALIVSTLLKSKNNKAFDKQS